MLTFAISEREKGDMRGISPGNSSGFSSAGADAKEISRRRKTFEHPCFQLSCPPADGIVCRARVALLNLCPFVNISLDLNFVRLRGDFPVEPSCSSRLWCVVRRRAGGMPFCFMAQYACAGCIKTPLFDFDGMQGMAGLPSRTHQTKPNSEHRPNED